MSAEEVDCEAAYDEWAATYDVIDNPLIAEASVALGEHGSWSGLGVLELGCGTGRNALRFLDGGAARFVGIDASAGMLAVARRRITDTRASFIEGDLASGTGQLITHDSFDVVLICLVLEHIEDVKPVIAAASSALARGGRLLVIELHSALHALGIGANFRVGEREVRLPSYRHTAEELTGIFEQCELTLVTRNDRAPSAAALAQSPKLARYASQSVLLELCAERR